MEALERAADAVVAEASPPLPLEFDLAGSGLVGSPAWIDRNRNKDIDKDRDKDKKKDGAEERAAAAAEAQRDRAAAAYRQAAHVVDVVVAESKAADALGVRGRGVYVFGRIGPGGGLGSGLGQRGTAQHTRPCPPRPCPPIPRLHVITNTRRRHHHHRRHCHHRHHPPCPQALCAIVAPDPAKQRWLLERGALPLMHRLTRTADDPRLPLAEAGQPGTEAAEAAAAAEAAVAADAAAGAAAAAAAAVAAVGAVVVGGGAAAAAPVVVSELMSDHEGGPSLCLQRQVARMLALVALLPEAQDSLGAAAAPAPATTTSGSPAAPASASAASSHGGRAGAHPAGADGAGGRISADGGAASWPQWLRAAAGSSDCRLSSNATRALLHMAALAANAAAVEHATAAAAGVAASQQPQQPQPAAVAAAAAAPGGGIQDPMLAAEPLPPVYLDGIHLLDPGARHHWALVKEAAQAAARVADARAATAAATTAAAAAHVAARGGAAARLPGVTVAAADSCPEQATLCSASGARGGDAVNGSAPAAHTNGGAGGVGGGGGGYRYSSRPAQQTPTAAAADRGALEVVGALAPAMASAVYDAVSYMFVRLPAAVMYGAAASLAAVGGGGSGDWQYGSGGSGGGGGGGSSSVAASHMAAASAAEPARGATDKAAAGLPGPGGGRAERPSAAARTRGASLPRPLRPLPNLLLLPNLPNLLPLPRPRRPA